MLISLKKYYLFSLYLINWEPKGNFKHELVLFFIYIIDDIEHDHL